MRSPDPASVQPPKTGPSGPRLRWWRNLLIVVFATGHAVKLLAGVLPEKHRPDLLPFGLGLAYERLTGSRQDWNMFETIPSHHAYRARIVITAADGSRRELGPLLPGFQAYPEPENARLYNLFERMLNGSMNEDVPAGYLRRVDSALRAEHRLQPGESWHLAVDEDFTRLLMHIRRDGRLFERRTRGFSLDAARTPPANP